MENLHGFSNVQDILDQYELDKSALDGVTIICAYYENEDYDGSSAVLYEKDGKIYLVEAGHCSCYGLEGQFESTQYEEKDLREKLESADSWEDSLIWVREFCKNHFNWK